MPGEYGRGHSPYNPELTEFTRSARTATRDAAMLGCARKIAEAIVKALAAGKNSIARDWQSCQVREFVKLEGALVKLFRGEPALLIKPQSPTLAISGVGSNLRIRGKSLEILRERQSYRLL